MERRYTRKSKKRYLEKLELTKAQIVFVKYVKKWKLQQTIRDFRKHWYIDPAGYESSGRYRDWLFDNFIENTFDYSDFKLDLVVLLIDCGFSFDFYDLLHEYVVSNFRFNAVENRNEDIFCSLQKPAPIDTLSKRPIKPSYYTLYVSDFADIEEIKDFIDRHKSEIEDQINDNMGSVPIRRKRNFEDVGRDEFIGAIKDKGVRGLLKDLKKHRLPPNKYKKHELVKLLTEEYGMDLTDADIQKIK